MISTVQWSGATSICDGIIYCGTVLHGVLSWYLGHISSMHGSVVGVSRVVSGLDQSEEGMTVRRVEAKVADQTW